VKTRYLAALVAVLHGSAVLAAPPDFKTSLDVRLRSEGLDTPARTAAADSTYSLHLARVRFGLDAKWTSWTLHGMAQAMADFDLPPNPAFGAGVNYLSANDGERNPARVGIAELSANYARGGLRLVLGRQPYADGNEVPTGVGNLDAIKRRLVSDRLVGVSEWPNTGRRFDGASFGYGRGGAHLAGFALRPLHGTFDQRDAFKEIDRLLVYGLTLTGKYGAWIPGAEVRLFAVQYEDGRAVARRQAGGDLSLTTAGASLLAGSAAGHVLLWGALQRGDWGPADQLAWAYIVNGGRNFPQLAGKPLVHLGWEQSSGDARPGGDHQTFFNLLPTNHRYYGILDYVDLPNLRDAYAESLWSLGEKVKARAAFHDFALTRRTDAWYAGSGAFEEESLGFTLRLPAGGRFPSHDLGREADLEVTWTLPRNLQLGMGGGYFWGGAAAEAFLPVKPDGSWTYVELTWKR